MAPGLILYSDALLRAPGLDRSSTGQVDVRGEEVGWGGVKQTLKLSMVHYTILLTLKFAQVLNSWLSVYFRL